MIFAITLLSHAVHCLCLSNKLCILTDELCSYLKEQTAIKQPDAVLYLFTEESAVVRPIDRSQEA